MVEAPRHGLSHDHQSKGLKGEPVAVLAAKVNGPVMFVDDLLP